MADEATEQQSGASRPSGGNLPQDRLLAGAHHLRPADRSLLMETLTRVVYPTALLVATYLLLVGLHHPGGGFAAGLTIGLALLLRRLAGGPHELGAATRLPPGIVLGSGLTLAASYGLAGLLTTGDLLKGKVLHLDLPVLPAYELPTSLLFEVGVLLIVVGLVLDVLRTLGAEAPDS